ASGGGLVVLGRARFRRARGAAGPARLVRFTTSYQQHDQDDDDDEDRADGDRVAARAAIGGRRSPAAAAAVALGRGHDRLEHPLAGALVVQAVLLDQGLAV